MTSIELPEEGGGGHQAGQHEKAVDNDEIIGYDLRYRFAGNLLDRGE